VVICRLTAVLNSICVGAPSRTSLRRGGGGGLQCSPRPISRREEQLSVPFMYRSDEKICSVVWFSATDEHFFIKHEFHTGDRLSALLVRFNPLDSKGNYSATSNNSYIWYSKEGTGRAAAPPSPLLAVPKPTHQRPVYQSLQCYMTVRCSAVLMWRLKS